MNIAEWRVRCTSTSLSLVRAYGILQRYGWLKWRRQRRTSIHPCSRMTMETMSVIMRSKNVATSEHHIHLLCHPHTKMFRLILFQLHFRAKRMTVVGCGAIKVEWAWTISYISFDDCSDALYVHETARIPNDILIWRNAIWSQVWAGKWQRFNSKFFFLHSSGN